MRQDSTHPIIKRHESDLGIRIANKMSDAVGSWKFIIIQSVVLVLWIVLNSVAWFHHWDSPPFILLNLCLSFQAAFTGPIILLASNASYKRDRRLWESDYNETMEDKKTTQEVLALLSEINTKLDKRKAGRPKKEISA